MANDFTIRAEALAGFRRMYGVNARPEDHPKQWDAIVAEIHDMLNEAMDELAVNDDEAPYWAERD